MRSQAPVVRRLAPVILATLLVVQAASVAGHHGGRPIASFLPCDRPVTPPRCTSVADSPRHLVAFDPSLTDGLASSLRDTMAEDYGATKLVLIEQERPTGLTDVIAFAGDYGENGAAGWVYCPSDAPQGVNPSGHRWCRQQEMHFNLNPRYAVFFADDGSRDHVTCHELGHTVGLRHWGNPPQTSGPEVAATCMNANTPDGPTVLHQFDIDHINAYGYVRHRSLRQVPVDGAAPPRLVPWTGSLEATQVEAPTSLAELAISADAVIRGEAIAVAPGRVFGQPGADALHYAAVTLRVDEILVGSLPARHRSNLVLEVPLFDGPESIDRLPAWGDAVFFLRNKGASAREVGCSPQAQRAEADFYRLMTFGSLVADVDGRAVTDPDTPILDGLAGRPFREAVELVRASAHLTGSWRGCVPGVCCPSRPCPSAGRGGRTLPGGGGRWNSARGASS